MKAAFVPPPPKKPHVTRRGEFKTWLIVSLLAADIRVPKDPTYLDLQEALLKLPAFKPEIGSNSEPNAAPEGAAT